MFKIVFLIFLLNLVNGKPSYNAKTKTIQHVTDDETVKMIVMGDWGGLPFFPYYSPFELVTSKQIMKCANSENSDLVLALGDNFYFNGVENEFDARFKGTFEDVFDDVSFKRIPWYVLAGNHDHYGNVTGEIAYTQHSERWNFPDLWYSIELKSSTFNMTILMIDTVTLCGNTLHDKYGSQPFGFIDLKVVDDQLTFIENKLKNNNDYYVLVAGHFPVWSIAEHGPTQCLLDKLKPLLEKYEVNAYLCGHDHNLQHIRETNSTVEYILSGAVDVVSPSTKHEASIPPDSLKFHWANILGLGGFATMDATADDMKLKFYSASGTALYNYSFPPRK